MRRPGGWMYPRTPVAPRLQWMLTVPSPTLHGPWGKRVPNRHTVPVSERTIGYGPAPAQATRG
jgi:hypothetical protein